MAVFLLGLVNISRAADFEPPPFPELFPGKWITYPYEKDFVEKDNVGFFRKEFNLPEGNLPKGEIFSAIVNVPIARDLYVNGKLVAPYLRYNYAESSYWTYGVDISKHLKPGSNVIGLSTLAAPPSGGFVYLEGNIIMASGEKIRLLSDDTWKYSPEAPANWSEPSFDASGWQKVKTKELPFHYIHLSQRMPAYSGAIVLENPSAKKLFYSESKDVSFKIKIPSGLESRKPILVYKINHVESGREAGVGQIDTLKKEGIALVGEISAGKLPKGVYVLTLTMKSGETVLEERKNEVFIVAGNIPQKKVDGLSIEEGMNLVLEDTINCWDEKDSHPFMDGGQTKSRIVKSNKLRYREAGPDEGGYIPTQEPPLKQFAGMGIKGDSRTGFFAYKIRLKEPSQPYLLVLEYPEDKDRNIQFQVNEFTSNPELSLKNGDLWCFYKESAGAVAGGIFPLSNGLKRLPLLYFPSRAEAFVTVNTYLQDCPAAASRILIYKVGDIPALDVKPSGERLLGKYSERAYSFRRMLDGLKLESDDYKTPLAQKIKDNQSIWSKDGWSPLLFSRWFNTIERFVQYLRFSGENLYIAGCYQYSEWNTGYAVPSFAGGSTSRLEPDYRELMAKVFSENDVALMAGLELQDNRRISFDPRSKLTDEEVAAGAETIWAVTAKGKQIKHARIWSDLGNIYHPFIQEITANIMGEITDKLADYPAFKGFYFLELPVWGNPVNPVSGYEDYTFSLFEKETGVKIPVDIKDKERFEKRFLYLETHKDISKKYIDWRCQKLKEIRKDLLNRVRAHKPDLQLVFRIEDKGAWKDSEISFNDYIKTRSAQDLSLYRDEDGLSVGRLALRYDGQDKIRAYKEAKQRVVISYTGQFAETKVSNPSYSAEWPWTYLCVFAFARTPVGFHYGEEFTRITRECDPRLLIFAWLDDQIFLGHEQAIRNFARGFLPLPSAKLDIVENSNIDSNLIVRGGSSGGKTIFWLINPGWWSADLNIEFDSPADKTMEVTDMAKAQPLNCKGNKFSLSLPPYGTFSLAISGEAKIKNLTVKAGKEAEEGVKEIISRTQALTSTPNVREILMPDEGEFIDASLAKASVLLKEGKYFMAWQQIANERFDTLLNDKVRVIKYVIPWLVIGPFLNNAEFLKKEDEGVASGASDDVKNENCQGFDTVFDAEKDVLESGVPQKEKSYEGVAGQKLTWRPAITEMREEHALMNFLPLFKPQNWTVAYAWTKVYSESEQTATMVTGSDDGLKVWLNGKQVQSVLKARGAAWGADKTEVILKKGANWVLVKVENRRGGFGFFIDFVDKDNKVLGNLKYSTK